MSKHFLRDFKRFNEEDKDKHKLLNARIEGAFEVAEEKAKKRIDEMKPV